MRLVSRHPVARLPGRRRFTGIALAGLALAMLATTLTATAPAGADPGASATAPRTAVVTPKVPTGLPVAIEPLAQYVKSYSCDPRKQPGTLALASLLKATYPTVNYGLNRSCTSQGEHSDGRAIDWMATTANATTKGYAKAFITWLLATDAKGNKAANARRLGVMYVIHDGRSWSSYTAGDGWREYQGCATKTAKTYFNLCHRDHVHISLAWQGARKMTSFWTKKVSADDYGPCRVDGQTWSYWYATARYTRCLPVVGITAPANATATQRALVTNSGQRLAKGNVGPGVKAIQLALGVTPTGTFGSVTEAAVLKFKASKGLYYNGLVGHGTWNSLLTTFVPKAIYTPAGRRY